MAESGSMFCLLYVFLPCGRGRGRLMVDLNVCVRKLRDLILLF